MTINKKENKIFELERANEYKIVEINKNLQCYVRESRKISEKADLLGKQYGDVEKKYLKLAERIFFVDERIDERDKRIGELVGRLEREVGEGFEVREERERGREEGETRRIELEGLRTEKCQNQLILDELGMNKLKVDELNGLIETLSGIANGTQQP